MSRVFYHIDLNVVTLKGRLALTQNRPLVMAMVKLIKLPIDQLGHEKILEISCSTRRQLKRENPIEARLLKVELTGHAPGKRVPFLKGVHYNIIS